MQPPLLHASIAWTTGDISKTKLESRMEFQSSAHSNTSSQAVKCMKACESATASFASASSDNSEIRVGSNANAGDSSGSGGIAVMMISPEDVAAILQKEQQQSPIGPDNCRTILGPSLDANRFGTTPGSIREGQDAFTSAAGAWSAPVLSTFIKFNVTEVRFRAGRIVYSIALGKGTSERSDRSA